MNATSADHMLLNYAVSEQRESTRFPKEPETDYALVWQRSGQEKLVEVHDESLTGISIVLSDISTFGVGAEADMIYHATLMRARVRHISQRADGKYLVGCECQRWA